MSRRSFLSSSGSFSSSTGSEAIRRSPRGSSISFILSDQERCDRLNCVDAVCRRLVGHATNKMYGYVCDDPECARLVKRCMLDAGATEVTDRSMPSQMLVASRVERGHIKTTESCM